MALDRSDDMIRVAYFFARYEAARTASSGPVPPQLAAIGAQSRADAIEVFRPIVGEGRSKETFRHSLEGDMQSIAARLRDGQPLQPSRLLAVGDLLHRTDDEVWEAIRPLAQLPTDKSEKPSSRPRVDWTREQQLAVLRLYLQTPFGKLHRANPQIIALANAIGRTPSAVAMKAVNFASLDPSIISTGRKGLSGASNADRDLWHEFQADSEHIALEAESVADHLASGGRKPADQCIEEATSPIDDHLAGSLATRPDTLTPPTGPTTTPRLIQTRRVQAFFRRAVLASYDSTCVITGLKLKSLLRASHILPWSTHPTRRADPTNGLCLSALFDAAFDRGLITIDEDLRVIVSKRLQHAANLARLHCSIADANGQQLILPPHRRPPDLAALEHHRSTVFWE